MKKILLLLLVTAFFQANAQEFEVRKNVITEGTNTQQGTYEYIKPMLVLESKGTSTELYQKALNWVNVTYKNPEEVIKGKVEGDYLRLEGFVSNLLRVSIMGAIDYFNVRYTVKLNFRDGRFKYEITNIEQYFPATQYSAGSWISILSNGEVGYRTANKKGKVKKDAAANLKALKSYFQNLGLSIKEYMDKNDASKTNSKDDW